jgi:hypothetical protein
MGITSSIEYHGPWIIAFVVAVLVACILLTIMCFMFGRDGNYISPQTSYWNGGIFGVFTLAVVGILVFVSYKWHTSGQTLETYA